MKSFDLSKVSQMAEGFMKRNRRLAYQVTKLEADSRHILYQANNLFSLLYCQITADTDLIGKWRDLQNDLFRRDRNMANRYLVYVVPDYAIRQANLYEELTRAEQNDQFFRKVFIGLPDHAGKTEIEDSLSNRIPLWFEEKDAVIHQYVPILTKVIPDPELLSLLLRQPPAAIIKSLEGKRFAYLFEGGPQLPSGLTGIEESGEVGAGTQGGPRITGLTVRDFRRFQEKTIDLDGDVVVVHGRNGTGKTTLCDALELSIFPELLRLQGDPDITQGTDRTYAPVLRAGSNAECAYVCLKGEVGNEAFSLETRTEIGRVVKTLNGKNATDEEVLQFLSRNENVRKRDFHNILLHTHFLGQHSIRDFIYGNRTDRGDKIASTRYELLAQMFGFGEVEQLKKRLSAILSQIRRTRISKADNQIQTVKTQIRGMQHKYGPKWRQDLEKKGYEITPTAAAERFRRVLQQAGIVLGIDLLRRINHAGDMPMASYRDSCENVRGLLAAEIKNLEGQATDLKNLVHLLTKLVAVSPDVTLPDGASVRECVETARHRIDTYIRAARQAQDEVEAIDADSETRNRHLANLGRFLQQFGYYVALIGMEQKEAAAATAAQEQKNALLERQSTLIAELDQATGDERVIKKRLEEAEQKVAKCERLRAALAGARAAQAAICQHTERIAVVDAAIVRAEQELSDASGRIPVSDSNKLHGPLCLTGELFQEEGHYVCPCCGMKHSVWASLEQGMREQLKSGKYRKELRAFLSDLERKTAEEIQALALETIQSHSRERANLENTRKAQSEVLNSFRSLAKDVGMAEILSQENVDDARTKHQAIVEAARRALHEHEAKSLRGQLTEVEKGIAAIEDDAHKKQLARIRQEILNLTSPLTDIVPSTEFGDRDCLKSRFDTLSAEAAASKKRRELLLQEIRSKGITEQKQWEFDQVVSEIESLLLRQETIRGYTPDTAQKLGQENLGKQRRCYEISREVGELQQVFGYLAAIEHSDALHSAQAGYEGERRRWEACYRSVESINTELVKLSHAGLRQSLDQYGPLINQIYQKFIRHDIFGALVLEPQSSSKGRRHGLYLRLRSYSGKTEYTPVSYLSEAQLNILALSIFLTRVMYQNISALQTVFIDDPIQQMDDMNAAAFVDVVLGLSGMGKQIIITTCNHEFYRLIAHKLHDVTTISFKAIDLD